MEKQYVLVDGDDWSGLYCNGRLISEGHSFSVREIFELIQENGGAVSRFNSVEADMDWLSDVGSLPEDLREVKLFEPGLLPAGLIFMDQA